MIERRYRHVFMSDHRHSGVARCHCCRCRSPTISAVQACWATTDRTFLFKPYVQLGNAPGLATPERAEIVWHTADLDADWWVAVRPTPAAKWIRAPKPQVRRVLMEKVEPHRIYHATVNGLIPGEVFAYRGRPGAMTR